MHKEKKVNAKEILFKVSHKKYLDAIPQLTNVFRSSL